MARVWIPSLLRDLTGGRETITVPGKSVRQLIAELDRLHPGVKDRLCHGDALRSGLAVVVDNEVARLGLLQAVGPDSEVHFLPAIAGGSDEKAPPQKEDNRSPVWVLILLLLLHAELWAAAGAMIFVIVPHMLQFEQNFAMKLPYAAEQVLMLALGFARFPPLFVALPVIDAVVLLAMHRTARSRFLRVAWSAVVVGTILFLLFWVASAQGMMMVKLQESFLKRPVPLAPPAP
jgi:molybdopterin converting factor small subunit